MTRGDAKEVSKALGLVMVWTLPQEQWETMQELEARDGMIGFVLKDH